MSGIDSTILYSIPYYRLDCCIGIQMPYRLSLSGQAKYIYKSSLFICFISQSLIYPKKSASEGGKKKFCVHECPSYLKFELTGYFILFYIKKISRGAIKQLEITKFELTSVRVTRIQL